MLMLKCCIRIKMVVKYSAGQNTQYCLENPALSRVGNLAVNPRLVVKLQFEL